MLDLYRHVAVTGAWWDVVDSVASRVGTIHQVYDAATAPVIRVWSVDGDLWLRRVAILSQLGHRDATDVELLRAAMSPNTTDSDFFIRKAIGWALREYAKTDAAWVRGFLADHPELSPLSRREALKHQHEG